MADDVGIACAEGFLGILVYMCGWMRDEDGTNAAALEALRESARRQERARVLRGWSST